MARVREHCQTVRGAILSAKLIAARFDDLETASGESKKLWEQLNVVKVQRCYTYRLEHEGTGRSGSDLPVTARKGKTHVVNEEGEWAPAPDDGRNDRMTNQMPYERESAHGAGRKRIGQPESYHDEKENRPNEAGVKHQKKDFTNSQCVICGRIGHRYLKCEKPWISIPRGM